MSSIFRCVAAVLLVSAPLMAAGPADPPRIVIAMLAANTDKCVIYGTVTDVHGAPIPKTQVRLRNLQNSIIEQVSTSTATGEFAFVTAPGIPYVVEVADKGRRVLAVGEVQLSRAGDLLGSVIIVEPSTRVTGGLFSSAANLVAVAAAGIGTRLLTPPSLSPEK